MILLEGRVSSYFQCLTNYDNRVENPVHGYYQIFDASKPSLDIEKSDLG